MVKCIYSTKKLDCKYAKPISIYIYNYLALNLTWKSTQNNIQRNWCCRPLGLNFLVCLSHKDWRDTRKTRYILNADKRESNECIERTNERANVYEKRWLCAAPYSCMCGFSWLCECCAQRANSWDNIVCKQRDGAEHNKMYTTLSLYRCALHWSIGWCVFFITDNHNYTRRRVVAIEIPHSLCVPEWNWIFVWFSRRYVSVLSNI